MSSDIAIRVTNLSKCYQIYDNPRDRLKQFVLPRFKSAIEPFRQFVTRHPSPVTDYYKEFWALKDVSFEVKRGETVGIIGRNGSGKSTLLQMICGTLNPTDGNIQTKGRIAALLELGSGFNPEFTGRENVYMNGAVLGMSSEEVDSRFDQIASFADIGEFIERPVKTYSSGMFVRLAFAVNIMSQPEIMVVDEALAVGDMAFQAKCMTALKRLQDNGVTVLFVSHDIGSVKSLCSQAVYLEHGQLKKIGKASIVAEAYVRVMREEMNEQSQTVTSNIIINPNKDLAKPITENVKADFKTSEVFAGNVAQFRYGTGGARITFAELLDENDQPLTSLEFNQQVKIRIYFNVEKEFELSANYYIQDDKKNSILGAGFRTIGHSLLSCQAGSRYIVTYSTKLPLQEGNYSVHLELTSPFLIDQTAEFIDVIDDALVFNMQRRKDGRIWAKAFVDNEVEILES